MRIAVFLMALAGASLNAWAQASATVAINTTQSTAINANFSGFNDEVVFPPEFFDYRQNNIAAQLSPGWVRYPSGLFSDAFSWQTGMMVPSWVAQFSTTNIYSLLSSSIPWVNGKGGGSFVDGANRANFLGAKLIIDVNAYTDTPASVGQMAAFAKANNIPVAVWELANEAYLYNGFFPTGIDYVTTVKPYRDAIKAADPNAVVAIFFTDPGDTNPDSPWNKSILSYPAPYWDAITYHHYPAQSTGPFSQWMADENAVLATKTNTYVTGALASLTPPGTRFLISEFLPSNDGLGDGSSVTDGTLYGAVYAAEYVMRMSIVPQMLYVGMHAMTGSRGVYAVDTNYTTVANAFSAGTTVDTLTLNFGFYLVAQPLGLAVLNGILRNATQADSTTVTGGPTVAATGLSPIPALYAQAYTTAAGQQSVVITNKGATATSVTISVNGAPFPGSLPITFIAGNDPTVQNTATVQNGVVIQTSTSTNPVMIPAYSVVRVDLNPATVVTAVNSASYAGGSVAPQEIVSLFGPNIAAQTAIASTVPLPTTLGGTLIQITDSAGNVQSAPLFSVSAGQANILIPSGLVAGKAAIAVLQGTAKTATGSVTIASSAPGLFSANADGAGVAAADALLFTPSGQMVNETVFTCSFPAARSCLGSPLNVSATSGTLYAELYGTGIRGAMSVQCFVAGQSVPVLYAGPVASDAGLDQVNIAIPSGLAGTGDVRVYVVANGITSNVVGLTIQ